jgi:hypothetical protein
LAPQVGAVQDICLMCLPNNEQITELRKLLMLYIEKNDKRVNDIIIALNNLIELPPKSKEIGFNTD